MSNPKVTVGIPTYNRAHWLRESIQSVLAQNYTDFRLIVSDNASDDDTPDVVRSFNSGRIHYVRSERNVGAIANLNRLIALADTDFLVLLPDDDVLYPDHLGAVVEVLERRATVGLVHTAFDVIDARSDVTRSANPLASRSSVKIESRDRVLETLMVSNNLPCFPSVAYRTKAIRESGGFRAELGPFCDLNLWMRVAVNWDFGYIATPLAGFRVHRESTGMRIGARDGVACDERERFRVYARMNFRQRSEFLDDVPLAPRTTKRLSGLARLQLLIDGASAGLPFGEVASGLADIVRTHPRIVLRPTVWRLVMAQLGGRRLRSALRGWSIARATNPAAKIASGVIGSRRSKCGITQRRP